jgi:hypothetical protein
LIFWKIVPNSGNPNAYQAAISHPLKAISPPPIQLSPKTTPPNAINPKQTSLASTGKLNCSGSSSVCSLMACSLPAGGAGTTV